MRRVLRLTTLYSLVMLLPACTAGQVTEIVVSVATDINLPLPAGSTQAQQDEQLKHGEIRVVRLKVERALKERADGEPYGDVVADIFWDLRPAAGDEQRVLPATLGLLPAAGRDLNDPILISISTEVYFYRELLEDKTISYPLQRQARLAFVKDEIIHLRMNLLSKCVYLDCPAGYTCGDDGTCKLIDEQGQPFDQDAALGPAPDGGFFREWGPEGSSGHDAADGGANDGASDLASADNATRDSAVDTSAADTTVDTTRDGVVPPVDSAADGASADITRDAAISDTLGADTTVDLLGPDATVDTPGADATADMPGSDSTGDTLGADSTLDTLSLDTTSDTGGTDLPGGDASVGDLGPDVLVDAAISPNCSAGWCQIPAGSFLMGSPSTEICRPPPPSLPLEEDDEILHPVHLQHAFEMAETETTEDQFFAIMAYDPSLSTCKKNQACPFPVEFVSWHEAVAYCDALNGPAEKCFTCTGAAQTTFCTIDPLYAASYYSCPGYRLPSDAEWEYAARAGTQTALPNGDITSIGLCEAGQDPVVAAAAWYGGNVSVKQEVGLKPANGWGLRDMHGNVWEWVYDSYEGDLGTASVIDPIASPSVVTTKVQRGGSFANNAWEIRSAHRRGQNRADRAGSWGFRCARTIP